MGRLVIARLASILESEELTMRLEDVHQIDDEAILDAVVSELLDEIKHDDEFSGAALRVEDSARVPDDPTVILVTATPLDTLDVSTEAVLSSVIRDLVEALSSPGTQARTRPLVEALDQAKAGDDVALGSVASVEDTITEVGFMLTEGTISGVLAAVSAPSDTAAVLQAETLQEDLAAQDAVSRQQGVLAYSETLDPFDPIVSVSDAAGDKSVFIRLDADTLQALVTRLSSTGTVRVDEGAVPLDDVEPLPLTAGVQDVVSLLAGGSSVRTLSKTEDATSSGHDLTENGGPTDRSSPMSKFGEGYDLDGTNDHLDNDGPEWNITGTFSAVFVFTVDTTLDGTLGEQNVFSINDEGGGAHAQIIVQGDGAIKYNDDSVAGPTTTSTISSGTHALWLTRDSSGVVHVKVFDGSGNVVVDEDVTASSSPTDDDGPYKLSLGSKFGNDQFLDGGIFEARVWSQDVDDATLDNVSDPTVRGANGYEQRLEGSELAAWFLGDNLILGPSPLPLVIGTFRRTAASHAVDDVEDLPLSALLTADVVATPAEDGPQGQGRPDVLAAGRYTESGLASQDLDSETGRFQRTDQPTQAEGGEVLSGAQTSEDAPGTPASALTRTGDHYVGTALTFSGSGATKPEGTIVRTTIDQDRGLGTVMVGEWATSGLPDETLDAILYSFQVPRALTNDVVTLKWELPAPNFVDNWHFATDPIGNEWTHVDGTTDVQFSHNIQSGFRSIGCVEIDSAELSTDRDQLHQRVTGLATGTGRTVTVKLHQIPADSGLASHEVHLRVYADDNGSKGAELANVLLASDDANWTEYTLVGDASGTQDFTIADDETALWVEIDANDQSITSSITRFFDDVRCEVSGLGEVTVAEQSPITPSKCSQFVVETFETYASGGVISDDGWDVQSSGNGESIVSTNNPDTGSQHLRNRINSGSGVDNQDATKLLDQTLSDALVEVPFAPNGGADTTQHIRLFDDSGNVFGEVIVDAGSTVSAEIEGTQVISGLTMGSGYGRVRFSLAEGSALGIELDLPGGQGSARADLGTARVLSDIEIAAERSAGGNNSRIDVDQILVKGPVAVDVSSHNIPRSDVHDLLVWVEYDDDGDGRGNAGVEGLGLRYEA